MNKYFSTYLDGSYETGKLYFVEAVPNTEWGVDFRLLDDDIRDDYETCLVFRRSNPMLDDDWELGTFQSVQIAIECVVDEFYAWF